MDGIKTKPIDTEKMTGIKENKDTIKESELCENCQGNFYAIEYKSSTSCGFENICKNIIACKNFCKEKGHIPSYYTNICDKYNGKDKDKMWDNVDKKEKGTIQEENKLVVTEKELCEYCGAKSKCASYKYSNNCDNFYETTGKCPHHLLKDNKYNGTNQKNVEETKTNKENNNTVKNFSVYTDSNCVKYPIDRNKEYVCIFDGNVINNNFVNINIYGIIIDINEKNIVIYNKENKNISMIDRKSVKCLLPKKEYNLIHGRD